MLDNVQFNSEVCTGCGLCVPVCPNDIFLLVGKKAELQVGACMACGHCQAACPVDAIRVAGVDNSLGLATIEEKVGTNRSDIVEVADLVHLMRLRRSYRNYTEEPVHRDVLEDLIRIGTTAPSGTNSQGWTFTIVPTREDMLELGAVTSKFYQKLNKQAENGFLRFLAKIFLQDSLGKYYRNYYEMIAEGLRRWEDEGRDLLFHGAPAAILVSGKNSASCSAEDAMLASQNVLLAAHSMGLGTCLIGFVVEAAKRDSSLRRAIKLPKDENLYSVIAIGHPKEKYCRPAGRKKVIPRYLQFTSNK